MKCYIWLGLLGFIVLLGLLTGCDDVKKSNNVIQKGTITETIEIETIEIETIESSFNEI